jgi:TAT (twin-arginine translocation) pathway signal sequence
MANEASLNISRRQFIATGGLTAAAAFFAPSSLIAQTGGLFHVYDQPVSFDK